MTNIDEQGRNLRPCGQCSTLKKERDETMLDKYEAERIRLEAIEDHAEKQRQTMCIFIGGQYNGLHCTEAHVEATMCNGKHSRDWSEDRAFGDIVPHKVLDNVPEVDGYTHMWDGGEIRYETWEVYNTLSN